MMAAFAPEALRRASPKPGRGQLRRACATVVAVMIGGASTVLACPQCFGAEEATLVGGTKLGILVLLGVTLTVQGAFVAFFLYLRKRAKRFAAFERTTDWSGLERTPRTS